MILYLEDVGPGQSRALRQSQCPNLWASTASEKMPPAPLPSFDPIFVNNVNHLHSVLCPCALLSFSSFSGHPCFLGILLSTSPCFFWIQFCFFSSSPL